MRFLIVDDSKAMRLIVRRNLRDAGYAAVEIIEKANGKEGFEWLQAETVDIVLSDWNMPEMTGIELLKSLRESGNAVRFGFVTSEGSAEMRSDAASAGALFLITKPFTADDFTLHLGKVFGGSK